MEKTKPHSQEVRESKNASIDLEQIRPHLRGVLKGDDSHKLAAKVNRETTISAIFILVSRLLESYGLEVSP